MLANSHPQLPSAVRAKRNNLIIQSQRGGREPWRGEARDPTPTVEGLLS